MSWSWLIVVWGLLRDVFTGPRPKSRIRVEVKSEAVIAEERRHTEELKAEVRRLENELKAIAPQITAAIKACDGHTIIDLNIRRRKLRDEWDTARQRLLDFERYIAQGR